MTPSARVQAAIDLLDEIIAAARDGGAAADTLTARYFRTRRYAGSKDRRAVRDLLYRAIRRCGERPSSGRAAMAGLAAEDAGLAALFDGSPHGPTPIAAGEDIAPASLLPGWIIPRLAPPVDEAEQKALLERAPLDLRVNRLKAGRDAVLAAFPDARTVASLPDALRLPEGTAIEQSAAYREGLVEIQDIGSQIIAMACAAQSGMAVMDLCAGAGGKTLALAAAMNGKGRLFAADVNRDRLARLPERAERSGAGFIQPLLLNPGKESAALEDLAGAMDVVLVDAPCSGTGTWRRNPEARWRLTEQRLARICREQAHILDFAEPLVKPGGRLVYAVCSLLEEEGAAQIEAFLACRSSWTVERPDLPLGREHGYGRLLTPAHDGTDGFFIATLLRS